MGAIDTCGAATVHPHSRGEYAPCRDALESLCGSPPLAWGIQDILIKIYAVARFTPTRVGNTRIGARANTRITVHPHSRGEYLFGDFQFCANGGSPPLAWGIRPLRAFDFFRLRFTPTRVGNTDGGRFFHSVFSVHPHSRGEYLADDRPDLCDNGSPPLAWGIRRRPLSGRPQNWFTPTRVGNT